jgi:cytochrome c5
VEKSVSAVVKKSEVRLTQEPAPDSASAGVPAVAKARIVAQTETEAVVEVTCDCGRKIRLRCTYPRAAN